MDPMTKTYVSLGLVPLALFEFWSAMRIFGRVGDPLPHPRLIFRLHKIGGYIFLLYFLWISWVCIDLMCRLAAAGNYELDARGFYHGFLAIVLIVVLLLKLAFIRLYRKYRPYVPLLGVILVAGTLVLWAIAGLMFLVLMGGAKTVTG